MARTLQKEILAASPESYGLRLPLCIAFKMYNFKLTTVGFGC